MDARSQGAGKRDRSNLCCPHMKHIHLVAIGDMIALDDAARYSAREDYGFSCEIGRRTSLNVIPDKSEVTK
jgi:hypothetical protein